jgi:hypothetical protein
LDEKVEIEYDDYLPRRLAYRVLVEDGLIPFLKTHGYVIACDGFRLSECIARAIYRKKLSHIPYNNAFRKEDYNYFSHITSFEDKGWEPFWESWSFGDFTEDHIGNRVLVECCVWSVLNLKNSPTTDIVDDILGLHEEEHMESIRDKDPYLIDAANGYFN